MAQELWLIMMYETDRDRWVIAEQHKREDDARAQRDLYRRDAEPGTVRMVHTADAV